MAQDAEYLSRALLLAERGRGFVEPNPLVGAVVVRDGEVVGEGYHQKFGGPHAEVHALDQAGERARGATLYVTLEPCCHFGKTPPCTHAVSQAGITRVVAAMADPFPQVAGRGGDLLRTHGIAVEFGLFEKEARKLNAPYLHLLHTGRPYVHLKWAMTLDGKMATRTGDSKWISNETSRSTVHQIRGRMDGILTGVGTVLADDPLLTARPQGPRTATRIVLDTNGRTPIGCRLVQTAKEAPVLLATTWPGCLEDHRQAGCEVLALPTDSFGRVDLGALLDELGRRRMTNLLVEGGAGVLGGFLDAKLANEVHVFIAPKIVGGGGALSPVGGGGVGRLADALKLSELETQNIDGDVYSHGRVE